MRTRTIQGTLIALTALLGVALHLGAVGCDKDGGNGSVQVEPGCNPLAANWDCLLPYPTDFYLVDDSAMPGGKRVVIPDRALPQTVDAGPVDFFAVHPADGFAVLPPILALFTVPPEDAAAGVEVSDANLVFWTGDVFDSTTDDSPTVLLEADTGMRVLHFAELDPRTDEPGRRVLVIRPLERLAHGTRYIVAIRRLVRTDGQPVPPGEGFALLRDGAAGDHPVLGQLVDHYEQDIFPQLADAGVDRSELQLAWDFTTATEENATADMLRARDLAIAALEAAPPPVQVTEVTDDYDNITRRVHGTMQVPLFLESGAVGARLYRDASGQVAQNGTTEVEFTVLIPRSVGDASPVTPARVMQFGHGFFGGFSETEGGFVRSFADQTRMVVVGVEWWGMSTPDLTQVVGDLLGDTQSTLRFTDRVHQAMVNQIALVYAVKHAMTALPELHLGGQLVYNPDEVYYYGISQGGILGGTYLALSPHIERGVLSVAGCSFPLMMFRSSNFTQFLAVIEMELPDFVDQQKFVALSATAFERMDPVTYAPRITADPYPGTPETRLVLLQVGLGDQQVPNVASELYARIMGLTALEPVVRPVPGVPSAPGPLDVSAFVEMDFGLTGELPGTYAIPPEHDDANPVHGGVRRSAAGIEQIDRFFHPDGLIEQTCDGVCDPE